MLERELAELWKKRRVVNDALAAAAAEGDRSENAEYIYRKKEQAGIDRRIRYLQKRLPDLNVISQVANKKQIFFGATVELEDEQGESRSVTIVGPDETNTQAGEISVDSPLARALLKKSEGDSASFLVEGRSSEYTIIRIGYEPVL